MVPKKIISSQVGPQKIGRKRIRKNRTASGFESFYEKGSYENICYDRFIELFHNCSSMSGF